MRTAAGTALLLVLALAGLSPSALASGADGQGSDDHPPTPGARGNLTLSGEGSAFSGTYVSGQLPAYGRLLANFSVQGTLLFLEIVVTEYVRGEVSAEGGQVEARGAAARIEITDALAAYIKIELGLAETLRIVPAPGASLAAASEGAVRLSATNASGLLWADCEGRGLVLAEGAAWLEHAPFGCTVYFRADTSADILSVGDLSRSLASGALGAEVSVSGSGENATVEAAAWAPLSITVAANETRVAVAVSADFEGGRSILVLLPKILLADSDAVEVLFDGRPMARASSATDALNASDDGGAPEYYLMTSGNLTAAVIGVPQFSVHLIEFGQIALAPSPPPPTLAAPRGVPLGDAALPIALGAVVATGLAVALLRRPNE